MNLFKYMFFLAFIGMIIITSVVSADEGTIKNSSFTLTKGKNNPVCKAFAERLKVSDFTSNYGYFPQCNRPENDVIEGFSQLTRTPLTVDEVVRLWDQVQSFLSERDSRSRLLKYPQYAAGEKNRASIIDRFAIDDEIKARNEWSHKFDNTENRPYRIDSPVDIDNDGMPDNIIIWRDPQQYCGNDYPSSGNKPLFHLSYVFVLDDQGNIDDVKTSRIFGLPWELNGRKYMDRATGKVHIFKDHQSIITDIGIVVYRNQTYFDGFYRGVGDINNRRKHDSKLQKTLGLFQHHQGKTSVVCELLWSGEAGVNR